MSRVTSKDGTLIAYERMGSGPAVILVGGGLDDGSENAPLVPELAEHTSPCTTTPAAAGATAATPCRTPWNARSRTYDALIAEAGGSVHLYGVSSGGALALGTAAAGLSGIDKLAVYEVPYNMADDWPERWQEYVEKLEAVPRVVAVTRSNSSCG
jgi:pimeloyl-ACP methyl ester carboxylesterase